jgi:hypothetical protein
LRAHFADRALDDRLRSSSLDSRGFGWIKLDQ